MKSATEMILAKGKELIQKQPLFRIPLAFKCVEDLYYEEVAKMRVNCNPVTQYYASPELMKRYFNHVNPLTQKK